MANLVHQGQKPYELMEQCMLNTKLTCLPFMIAAVTFMRSEHYAQVEIMS